MLLIMICVYQQDLSKNNTEIMTKKNDYYNCSLSRCTHKIIIMFRSGEC